MILHSRLSYTKISSLVVNAEREIERKGAGSRDRLRFRFILEEILLFYREILEDNDENNLTEESQDPGERIPVELSLKRKGEELHVLLSVPGPPANPMDPDGEYLMPVLSQLLAAEGISPTWEYRDEKNRVACVIPLYYMVRQNLRFTWSYTKDQSGYFALGVVSQLFSVVLRVIAPLMVGRAIVALTQNSFHQLILAGFAILGVNALTNLVLFICNRAYNVVYNRTLSALETDLVDKALHITTRCMEEKGSGLFIQRLTNDTSQLATGFNTMADMVSETFQYIGILGAILIISPPIFLTASLLMAVQTAVELIRTRKMNTDDRIYRTANERYTGFVGEMVRGARDVKLFHGEDTFRNELETRITDANNKRMVMQGHSWAYKLARQWIGDLGFLLYTVQIGYMLVIGRFEPAIAVVLFNYYTNLGAPFALLIGDLLEFVKNFNLSNERVHALVEGPDFPKETFGTVHKERLRGEIRFDHVSFAYRGKLIWVIKDMSFTIRPGETVALVGRSGCGKTTTFSLISKLYTADRGTIYLDGVDINELDAESIRSNMAVVSQYPYIFNLSVRDNLRLAKPDMTEEAMASVCRMACLEEDIRGLPEGYDTIIGEGGTNLSGGQLQRLAIARAFLIDAPILLFDEATSSLDNMTQAKIGQAIDNIRKDRTVIIIAHRLSTILSADRIMYLQDGRVLDQGTHEELYNRCEPYRSLYEKETVSGH